MTTERVLNIVKSWVQPLYQGFFEANKGTEAHLGNIAPAGSSDHHRVAYPFGMVARPAKGTLAYVMNLFGSRQRPIIINHYHHQRPAPSADGENILYSTDAAGAVKVTLTLKADGTLVIVAPVKVQVHAPAIELGQGALEKVFKSETFQTRFNEHVHVDSMGGTTQPPTEPSPAGDLSTVVKNV